MKKRKFKAVNYRLIDRASDRGKELYALLTDLVDAHHRELSGARIALAWNLSWKPDVDGRVTLGKCKKASDLDRELAAFDFVILLRQEFVDNPLVSDLQRRALMDHELCHAAVAYDGMEPKVDERGRTVYRVRKHDIEEFAAIVERYGCYKRDLEAFAAALRRGPQLNLTDVDEVRAAVDDLAATVPEGGSLTLSSAGRSVTLTAEDGDRARRRVAQRQH